MKSMKLTGSSAGAGTSNRNTVSDEATIHLQIENIFKDEMAFDDDKDRILGSLRNHFGNPDSIWHDGCFYYIDTGKSKMDIRAFDDWYLNFIQQQKDEIIRRKTSSGFPRDCSEVHAEDFARTFYGLTVYSAYGIDPSAGETKDKHNGVYAKLAMHFELGKSVLKSDADKAVDSEISIHTRRGQIGKPAKNSLHGVFTETSYGSNTGSGIDEFWIHTSAMPSCIWLSEMAHIGLDDKLDIDSLTLRAWPNRNWNNTLKPGAGRDLPYDF